MLIGYARVSSAGDRQSFDLQRDALTAAGVDARNIYQDQCSGAAVSRPGLDGALAYLQAGDVLVIWKLDRLGRSLSHLLQIIEGLHRRDVGLKSLTEGMDTTTAAGIFFFQVFGALAQYERSLIQERVAAGLAAAERRGQFGGRPRAVDDEKLAVIRTAIDGGLSVSAACRTFGVKRSTLVDALKRLPKQA